MIINIEPGTFGGPCRAGDLIGVANAVEHLRQVNNNVNIKFHMKQGTIDTQKHCREFFSWLTSMTDYFLEPFRYKLPILPFLIDGGKPYLAPMILTNTGMALFKEGFK